MRNRRVATLTLIAGVAFLFLVFSCRFIQIMVVGYIHQTNLKKTVSDTNTVVEVLPAHRGTIYDIEGNEIAVDAKQYTLYAVLTGEWSNNTDYVMNPSETAAMLAKYIDMSVEDIQAILTQDAKQVYFGTAGNNVSVDVKLKIEAEQFPGIKFEEKQSRYYTNGVFASHLIGYTALEQTGTGSSVLVGQMGLEALYNDVLAGKNGQVQYQVDGEGYPIENTRVILDNAKEGNDIYVTLDKKMQAYLETLMTSVEEKYTPKAMTAMLVEPSTGNIVAASQRPTFNATTLEGISNTWDNFLTDREYEPGSTMKVLALAAAINEGKFDPNATYQSGSISIYEDVVRDYNKVGWGTITYLEGIAHSSNVAFVKIIQEIGVERWKEYLDAFGFEKSTHSGFVNEASGQNTYASYLQQLSTGFGQGINVTVYQMMQAFTAIANEGKMMKLRLIDRYEDGETGEIKTVKPVSLGSVISKEAAQKTLEYLYAATKVNNATTSSYTIKNEPVAIKTGTAELVNPQTGRYYEGGYNYIYSVVGFAPATNPRYIFYITMQQPYSSKGVPATTMINEVYTPFLKRALEYARTTQSN